MIHQKNIPAVPVSCCCGKCFGEFLEPQSWEKEPGVPYFHGKSSMFNRDPYFMVYYNPHITGWYDFPLKESPGHWRVSGRDECLVWDLDTPQSDDCHRSMVGISQPAISELLEGILTLLKGTKWWEKVGGNEVSLPKDQKVAWIKYIKLHQVWLHPMIWKGWYIDTSFSCERFLLIMSLAVPSQDAPQPPSRRDFSDVVLLHSRNN